MSLGSLRRVHEEEAGHAVTLIGLLPPAAGAVLLGIGAANDTGWLAIAGGIVAGLGIVFYDLVRHTKIDYAIYRRLDELEGKK
jgi:hypothetical protein